MPCKGLNVFDNEKQPAPNKHIGKMAALPPLENVYGVAPAMLGVSGGQRSANTKCLKCLKADNFTKLETKK